MRMNSLIDFDNYILLYICLYLNCPSIIRLSICCKKFHKLLKNENIQKIIKNKYTLEKEDVLLWKNELETENITEIEQALIYRKINHPLLLWRTDYLTLNNTTIFNPMLELWKEDVAYISTQSFLFDIKFLYDLELSIKIAKRVKFYGSEWFFGNESSFSWSSIIINWDNEKKITPTNVSEVMNCVFWEDAQDYTEQQIKERKECPEAFENINFNDDLDYITDLEEYKNILQISKDKGHTRKKSKTFKYNFNNYWKKAEPILSLLNNRRTYTLATNGFEPEPVLHFGQSKTGNLIGLLLASGWTWG